MKQHYLLNDWFLIFMLIVVISVCKAKRQDFIKSVNRGNISQLLRSLKYYPRLKPTLKTYYKEAFEETTPSWKFPTVRNLEEYLTPFSQCFVHITNFQNVDLQLHSNVPILVRHQIPTKITATPYFHKESLTWAPKSLDFNGSTIKNPGKFDCPFSNYTKDFLYNGICSSIDKINFASNIRPWNCEVTLLLFPPHYLFSWRFFDPLKWYPLLPIHLEFPPVWALQNRIGYYDTHYESNVFNIWILDELYEKTWRTQSLIRWMKNSFIVANETEEPYFIPNNKTDPEITSIKNLFYDIEYFAMSEVFELISSFVVKGYKSDLPSSEYKNLNRLWKNTKILPKFWKLYKNVQNEVGISPSKSSRYYYQKFHASLANWQDWHSFEILKDCDKVAVLLPALTCHQMARKLTEVENLADVHVGKEVLYERGFKIRMSGLVPVNKITRAKRMLETGIWDFWSQIFRHGSMFREDQFSDTTLKAPSMSGNIAVVFAIILLGLACSMAVFVIEIRKLVYYWGITVMKAVKNAFQYGLTKLTRLYDRKNLLWLIKCSCLKNALDKVIHKIRIRC
ncbi:unnamed protein product [Orchesella dallaii]|uniref:Uncharacterized protein n=1 Tax=Orchesella dallaii TaxID=48710 RepID=A0ABP1QFW2_9HEXA